MNDLFLLNLSRTLYEERLKEAEQERRALAIRRATGQSWTTPLLLHLSQWLINTGVWLKEHNELRPSLNQR
jgi:hypothetical protein